MNTILVEFLLLTRYTPYLLVRDTRASDHVYRLIRINFLERDYDSSYEELHKFGKEATDDKQGT